MASKIVNMLTKGSSKSNPSKGKSSLNKSLQGKNGKTIKKGRVPKNKAKTSAKKGKRLSKSPMKKSKATVISMDELDKEDELKYSSSDDDLMDFVSEDSARQKNSGRSQLSKDDMLSIAQLVTSELKGCLPLHGSKNDAVGGVENTPPGGENSPDVGSDDPANENNSSGHGGQNIELTRAKNRADTLIDNMNTNKEMCIDGVMNDNGKSMKLELRKIRFFTCLGVN